MATLSGEAHIGSSVGVSPTRTDFSVEPFDMQPTVTWNRSLEAIGSKHAELADMQWRVVRDQMGQLQHECDSMNAKHALHDVCQSDLDRRIDELAQQVGSVMREQEVLLSLHDRRYKEIDLRFQGEVAKEVGAREADIAELKELVNGERLARQEHHGSVLEISENERSARRAYETKVKGHFDDYEQRFFNRLSEHKDELRRNIAEHRVFVEERHNSVLSQISDHRQTQQSLLFEHHARVSEDHTSLAKRVGQLEGFLRKTTNTDERCTLVDVLDKLTQSLRDDVAKEATTREADIYKLRQLLGGEQLARQEHHGSVQELFRSEREARETHEKKVEGHLEVHEARLSNRICEQMQHHQSCFDEQHARANERWASLKERVECVEAYLQMSAGGRCNGSIRDELDSLEHGLRSDITKEVSMREAENHELRQLLGGEKLTQQEHHSSVRDIISSEREVRERQEATLRGRLEEHEATLLNLISKHKEAHQNLLDEHYAKLSKHHASVQERVDNLEAYLQESTYDPCRRTLKDVLDSLVLQLRDDIAQQTTKREADVYNLVEQHRSSMQQLFVEHQDLLDEHHAKVLSHISLHRQEQLSFLDDHHAKACDHQASMQERVTYLEAFLRKTDDHDMCSLKDVLDRLEESLRDVIAEEANAREANISELRDLFGAEQLARREHHCFVWDLVRSEREARESSESTVRGQFECHGATLLKQISEQEKEHRNMLDERYGLVQERVERLEAYLQESVDDHVRGTLRDVLDRCAQQLRDEIAKEARIQKTDLLEVRELVGGEQFARQEQHNSIRELVDNEKNAREMHAAALHAHVSNQCKMHRSLIDEHHVSLQQRIEYIETFLLESVEEHDRGTLKDILESHRQKLEQIVWQKVRTQGFEELLSRARQLSENGEETAHAGSMSSTSPSSPEHYVYASPASVKRVLKPVKVAYEKNAAPATSVVGLLAELESKLLTAHLRH
mmetsp:Transcript_17398/g.47483  ORF Transcript_17398/g.47483 Transcript_17398/m.47483 type:complete len:967 (-) Transcript_17398:289-3189(-)